MPLINMNIENVFYLGSKLSNYYHQSNDYFSLSWISNYGKCSMVSNRYSSNFVKS